MTRSLPREPALRHALRVGVAATCLALASLCHLAAATMAPPSRPVLAWANGLFETRVAFDGPVDPTQVDAFVGRPIALETGTGRDDRGTLSVTAARRGDDGRSVVLTTDPHPRAGRYTIRVGATAEAAALSYELTGVEAVFEPKDGDETKPVTTWWPGLDPAALPKLAAFDADRRRLAQPGKLTLTTLLIVPPGPAIVSVTSDRPVEATLNGEEPNEHDPGQPARFEVESTGEPLLFTVAMATEQQGRPLPTLDVRLKSGDGPSAPITAERTLLPWATPASTASTPSTPPPDLSGGNPARGAEVFKSAEAKCANCHKVRGQGAEVGPDLSPLAGQDRAEVYRDIAEPSARIHPDYVPYTVALKDGRVLVGTVRSVKSDALRITDTEAKATVVPRAEVEEIRPSATSIMPVGLAGVIGEERLRDLIAFLTAPAR